MHSFSTTARACALAGLLAFAVTGTAQALPTTTKTAIAEQSADWHYQQVAFGDGDGFQSPSFDDSAWSLGQAAFGSSSGSCAFNSPAVVHTGWGTNSDLLLRKSFTLPPNATNVRVGGTVDNEATVYVNGTYAGFTSTGFCNTDTIDFAGTTAQTGTNVLAIRARDLGGTSFVDAHVTYEVPSSYLVCALYDQTKSAKLGSTVPLKLRLCDETGGNLSDPGLTVHAVNLTKIDNSASSTVADSGNANAGNDFRYDASLGGYIYNLSTKGLSAGTWKVTFTVDGAPNAAYSVNFDVK